MRLIHQKVPTTFQNFQKEGIVDHHLGTGHATKSDEFLEKIQTAFDPPPLIFGKIYCIFFGKRPVKALYEGPKSAI